MVANHSLTKPFIQLLGYAARDGHDCHPTRLYTEHALLEMCMQHLWELRALAATRGSHDDRDAVVVNLLEDAFCVLGGRKHHGYRYVRV